MEDFLKVKPGDPITSDLWNKFLRASDRANVNYGGENTRVTKTTRGTFVNAKHLGGWLHPWRVTVSSQAIAVYPGLINGSTPTINDRPMTEKNPPPLLQLTDNFNNGLGWVALEITTKKNDKDTSDKPNEYAEINTAKVVQCQMITGAEATTNNPFFYFGLPGIGNFTVRYPLARLQKVGAGLSVFQVAMFNLNWKAKPPNLVTGTGGDATGSAFPRHFFWPA